MNLPPGMADVRTNHRFNIGLPVRIRRGTGTDRSALEWFGMFSGHRSIIQATFDRQERGESAVLVADANGFPVGQVWIDFAEDRAPPAALLWAIRVMPPLQRTGIGAQLMISAEQVVRERSISEVELTVQHGNHAALRFYRRLGYRVVGTERDGKRHPSPAETGARAAFDQWVLHKSLTGRA